MLTPGITDMEVLIQSAENAAGSVIDCEVTQAVRDAVIDGNTIKQGQFIAINNGKIVATADSAEEAALQMLEQADADLCEIITLFVGKQVSHQRRVALTEQLKAIYCDCEITVYEGGQEVYDYFLALE